MKHVAIIIQKLNGGGAERTASNLSMFLKDLCNVHLIVFDGREITYPYAGVFHDLKLPALEGKANKVLNFYKRVAAVKKLKKENNIDYSISLMDGANLVNALSCVGDKVITSVRIQMSKSRNVKQGLGSVISRKTMQFIGKKSYKVVALSKGVEEDLLNVYGVPQEKLVTIYNPCDYEVLLQNAEKNNIQLESGNAIVTMGRLTEQKGQWHLIRAISEVKKTIPDIKLYILGEGPLKERLDKLVVDMDLQKHVKLLGYIKAPHACFKFCDAFVFPSEFEGLGNVLLEAMAFGLPCISSDCYSGPREILAPGTTVKEHLDNIELAEYGILTSVCGKGEFNSNDPLTKEEKQLAEAIVSLLTDKALMDHYHRMSLNRREAFTPVKITNDWMALLK